MTPERPGAPAAAIKDHVALGRREKEAITSEARDTRVKPRP